MHLEGKLTLNLNRVRLVSDIDLNDFTGTGYLIHLEEVSLGQS